MWKSLFLFLSVYLVAPTILKIISTGIAKYTISWHQPSLPNRQTVIMYHTSYRSSEFEGSRKNQSRVSKQRTSITIDVKFDQRYEFAIQVETKAGKSDEATKSWFSHSGIGYYNAKSSI